MRTNIHNNGGVHGTVVAGQEFANTSSAKCGFTSPTVLGTITSTTKDCNFLVSMVEFDHRSSVAKTWVNKMGLNT